MPCGSASWRRETGSPGCACWCSATGAERACSGDETAQIKVAGTVVHIESGPLWISHADSACATHFWGATFRGRDDETALEASAGNRWNQRGKLKLIGPATMPAAASENTLGELLGGNLANRRCSEWRGAGRSPSGGQERRKESQASARRNGKSGTAIEGRSRNRQVESKGRKARADRLTGPDAGE